MATLTFTQLLGSSSAVLSLSVLTALHCISCTCKCAQYKTMTKNSAWQNCMYVICKYLIKSHGLHSIEEREGKDVTIWCCCMQLRYIHYKVAAWN